MDSLWLLLVEVVIPEWRLISLVFSAERSLKYWRKLQQHLESFVDAVENDKKTTAIVAIPKRKKVVMLIEQALEQL